MKICVFQAKDRIRIGALEGDKIKAFDFLPDLLGVADLGEDEIKNPTYSGEVFDYKDVDLLPPVMMPTRVFGLGLNYLDHARETGREPPKTQTWFMKQPTSINMPYGVVNKPVVSDMLDFEVELVVIIGKRCKHVSKEDAHKVILGYTIGCDYSVRDWQKATPTMIMGKGFDTHAPIGPFLVTPDELGNIDEIGLRCFVNNEKVQDGCAKDLIFKIPEMIEHLSAAMTLLPGDVIFTGTPAGVGMARTPPLYLKDGDNVRCEIDKIGHIEHIIKNEIKETIID